MKIAAEYLNAVKVISLDRHSDDRGFFMEIWSLDELERLGIVFHPVQDNRAHSLKRGTVRGLHFQRGEYAQAKLIHCMKGSFYNIAADLRIGSPTFGQTVCIPMKESDDLLVYIPRGFAHGVAIIEDGTEYTYKVDTPYNGANSGGLSVFYDPEQLNLEALLPDTELILSEKDLRGLSPSPEEAGSGIYYEENQHEDL